LNIKVVSVVAGDTIELGEHFRRAGNSWHGSIGAYLLSLQAQQVRKMDARCICLPRISEDDTYSFTFEVVSRYSRIGKLVDILEAIMSKGARVTGLSKETHYYRRIWTVDISGVARQEDMAGIINALRCIPDTSKRVMNTKSWILEFEIAHEQDKMRVIQELTRHRIKIKHFFAPRFSQETSKRQVFFEVNVPKQLNILKIKGIIQKLPDVGIIKLRPGRIIDEIASGFKDTLHKTGIIFTRDEWKLIKKSLELIANRHFSQVRKDGGIHKYATKGGV
jgi:hypothetical protein